MAIKLLPKGEKSLLQEHPWVFKNSIKSINKDPENGDLAIVFSQKDNKLMGIGLYDTDSPIAIKMIHYGGAQTIDGNFWQAKVKDAYIKREALLETDTNSYRLLFGENDGFPGLIADVYNKVLVVKLYSRIWYPFLSDILQMLIEISEVETAILRLSRQLQQYKDKPIEDGEVVYGHLENEVVHFKEHGVSFSANVIKGHKTGYFLDHRANRKRVGTLSKGKTVLDVFAYAGGFSVHALAGGAQAVTSLDISAQALKMAHYNASLNDYDGAHQIIVGDAFTELQTLINKGTTFDVVVIDPPSFAKQQSEITVAKKKYAQLAALGTALTTKGGMLVLASCSSRITARAFFDINKQALLNSQRTFNVELQTAHDIDHPVSFREGAYLKCGYYKFEG